MVVVMGDLMDGASKFSGIFFSNLALKRQKKLESRIHITKGLDHRLSRNRTILMRSML